MRNVLAGLMVAMGLFCGVALAQNAQRDNQAQPGPGGQRASAADQQIAACIYGACSHEIEIAKWAESRLQSEEAREFAQRMVREHTPGCQAMQQLAGNLVSGGPTAGQATTQPGSGNLDWISIHKQIGEQCLANLKQELGTKQGIELDKCFLSEQIGEHLGVIASLKVLRNYASNDLREKLDKELQMVQMHLQQAKQIEQQLKDRPSERVSRKPESK